MHRQTFDLWQSPTSSRRQSPFRSKRSRRASPGLRNAQLAVDSNLEATLNERTLLPLVKSGFLKETNSSKGKKRQRRFGKGSKSKRSRSKVKAAPSPMKAAQDDTSSNHPFAADEVSDSDDSEDPASGDEGYEKSIFGQQEREEKRRRSVINIPPQSMTTAVMSSFQAAVDPTTAELFDEDASEKSIFQLARDGDMDHLKQVLDTVASSKLKKIINLLDSNRTSALHYAARYDFLDIVKLLVENEADPNIKGEDDLTPLHFCARYKIVDRNSPGFFKQFQSDLTAPLEPNDKFNNYKELKDMINVPETKQRNDQASVIKYLAKHGGRVNQRDRYGLTPLHYAAMRGNDEAAMELLSCDDIDIECKDEQLLTPLHLACTYGQINVAKMLLVKGADYRCVGDKGQTSLHKACATGSISLVKLITEATKSQYGHHWKQMMKSMLEDEDIDGNSPLLLGVESGSVEITKHLLSLKAAVNHYNKTKTHALHLACTIGSLDIVKLLFENNAAINCINNNFQTPLLVAAAYNHLSIIEFLLKKGAKIDRRDKDGRTPLHLAALEGNPEAVELLLKHGADIFAVDKFNRTVLFCAASGNHYQTVEVLLLDPRSKRLLDAGDKSDNTPLHVAAANGYLAIVIALLDANTDVDNKNEDEQTAIHVAAKAGRTRICKEILGRDRFSVNDEDSDSNTALHLACIHGHSRVVSTLIAAGADIEARNYYLWTPLDCAAAYGQPKCVKLLLDANAPIDPMDKMKTTPLHLTARYGHDKTASLLIERGASLTHTNSRGHNALTVAILHGKRDVAQVIIDSDNWLMALKSEFISPVTRVRETPLRLLIKQFPDLAKRVFDRCMITNLQSDISNLENDSSSISADDPRFSITVNYELLDDAYCLYKTVQDDHSLRLSLTDDSSSKSVSAMPWSEVQIWDDNDHLIAEAESYSKSSTILKLNHPLMIMVKEKRTNLLGHPLCMALVRHKWNSFGRYVYYSTLAIYFIFVIFLTDFILNTPAPYSAEQIIEFSGMNASQDMRDSLNDIIFHHRDDQTFGTARACEEIRDLIPIKRRAMALYGQVVIIGLAIFHLVKELFQFTQTALQHSAFEWAKMHYIGIENLIEWICYITAILFVLDFSQCHRETGLRKDWQWQLGAISITGSWLNLLSNVRKFPLLGIYVVMFTDVFRTFLKFSVICLLFVVAFSLGFYALLSEQENFGTFGYSLVKTSVMMIGEFEYDDLFFDNLYQDPDKPVLPYPTLTIVFFVIFLCIMAIIVMNLLVGLAVDDIKAVQDNAVLQRLAMQVNLNLDVEKLLPEFLRRRFIVRQEKIFPNRGNSIFTRIFDQTLKRIAVAVVAHGNETELQRVSQRQDEVMSKMRSFKDMVKAQNSEIDSIKRLLVMMATQMGLNYEEEDNET